MASQIDTLRTQFEQMNLAQKKAFIERLRLQLKGKSNPFLNECVQKYNAAVRGGSPVPTIQGTAAISKPKKSPLKWIAVCVAVILIIGSVGLFGYPTYVRSQIIGTWFSELYSGYRFYENGKVYFFVGDVNGSARVNGTYTILGNRITYSLEGMDEEGTLMYKNGKLYKQNAYTDGRELEHIKLT